MRIKSHTLHHQLVCIVSKLALAHAWEKRNALGKI